eukprot:TRINITY_DN31941_c0_g1_i1.p1 TRINITY_DN31941_c0_g1~~TRINITY_DN31941_c0_g1_i1.p1  ORF type:complete len:314 (-),score=57.06 TRINITY_DN31941_c0_g1_i1:21-875(-)
MAVEADPQSMAEEGEVVTSESEIDGFDGFRKMSQEATAKSQRSERSIPWQRQDTTSTRLKVTRRACCVELSERQRQLGIAVGFLSVVVLLVTVVVMLLFWPRDPPQISVSKLEFGKQNQFQSLMSVMRPETLEQDGNASSTKKNSMLPEIPAITILSQVSFENQNLLSVEAEPAQFDVYFHDALVATGHGESAHLPGKSQISTSALVTINPSSKLATELAELLGSQKDVMVEMKAATNFKVAAPFGLGLRLAVQCSVRARISETASRGLTSSIASNHCDYGQFR